MPPETVGPRAIGEITTRCECVWKQDMDRNLERGWTGLSRAKRVESSPLSGHENGNLWVTGTMEAFREHLRHVALRQGFNWMFKVVTDLDMMDAWLSKNVDPVHDTDIAMQRKGRHGKNMEVYISLTELIEPPELLILRLGVKVTRNAATAEALLETLQHRQHLGKPTWVVDQPIYRLQEGHLAFDARVGDFLADWECITLERKEQPPANVTVTGAMPSLSESFVKAKRQKGEPK